MENIREQDINGENIRRNERKEEMNVQDKTMKIKDGKYMDWIRLKERKMEREGETGLEKARRGCLKNKIREVEDKRKGEGKRRHKNKNMRQPLEVIRMAREANIREQGGRW